MKEWRASRRRKALRRLVRRAPLQSIDRQFRALLAAGVRQFRGPEALATSLVAEIKRVQSADPGNQFALHGMLAILRLTEFSESRKEARPAKAEDLDLLTEEQLRERIQEGLRGLALTEPEIVLRAAASIGWSVTPPPNG